MIIQTFKFLYLLFIVNTQVRVCVHDSQVLSEFFRCSLKNIDEETHIDDNRK